MTREENVYIYTLKSITRVNLNARFCASGMVKGFMCSD